MKQQLQQLSQFLHTELIEREMPAKLALLAALSGEHLLLFGAPGTAKSALARRLQHIFTKGQYFERLLTRFSVPEELFGPLSIKALENDRYERLTDGYLPSASIAFIDEIFKANSAILNSLLTLLNEREFDNGQQRVKTPLVCVIAASNELPDEEELQALYDRFLFRYHVNPVSKENFQQLLQRIPFNTTTATPTITLQRDTIQQWQDAAQQLPLHDDVLFLLTEMHTFLAQQGIYVSDRRWVKIVQMLKIAAFSNQQTEVLVWDCWLLQFCLWETPEQQASIDTWYQQHLGTHQQLNPERINKLLQTWKNKLKEEQQAKIQCKNAQGEPLYLDPYTQQDTTTAEKYIRAKREDEYLYLAPPDQTDRTHQGKGFLRTELAELFFDDYYQQCHINGKWVTLDDYIHDSNNHFLILEQFPPKQVAATYSKAHIQSRISSCQALQQQIESYHQQVQQQLQSLTDHLPQHLWLTADFIQQAEQSLQQTLQNSAMLIQQIKQIQQGFQALPPQRDDANITTMQPA